MLDFNEMVTNFVSREQKAKQIGRYYPSEIGSCLRKVWYGYKHPQAVSPELLKIFAAGNIVHEFVVEVLKSEKNKHVQLLEEELPFKHEMDGFVISGRIDDLVLLKHDNKKVLVEVKSAKSTEHLDEPKLSNEIQLILYMHLLGIHDGVLLYVDKTNLQSKVFTVPYSQKRGEEILQRFKNLDTALRANELPLPEAKEIEGINWMCRFCEYAQMCDKNEK